MALGFSQLFLRVTSIKRLKKVEKMKLTSNQIHNISLANNFLAAKDKANISNTTVRIKSTKRINPSKKNNLTKPEYIDINGSYDELCMTVCECQLVASGRNNLVRNTIVIDYDRKENESLKKVNKKLRKLIKYFKKKRYLYTSYTKTIW